MENQKSILGDYNIPKHIAIIMDGNGRWAQEKGKKRTYGHKEGSNTLKRICKDAYNLGVKYVTVYAFSTENWKRSKSEVDYLMKLLKQFLKESTSEANKNNMKITIIGNREGLPLDIRKRILALEESSKTNDGLNLQIALNYGAKNEIIRAIQDIYKEFNDNNKSIDELNEDIFSQYLDTKDIPEPETYDKNEWRIKIK